MNIHPPPPINALATALPIGVDFKEGGKPEYQEKVRPSKHRRGELREFNSREIPRETRFQS